MTARATCIAFVGLALAIAGCGGGESETPALDVPRVIATTGILGDVVSNIVGDDAIVEVLIPDGADPHDYQATSRQVAAVHQADLVVSNGLSLEGGLIDVLDAARADGAAVISVGEFVDPIPFATGSPDPHVWLDPHRVADAARLIAVELAAVSDDVDWIARAEAYADELLALDAEIDAMLSTIPADARQIVTNHDALGYFAARYDFEIVGVVVRGGSTVANPSSAELAELVAQISSNNIRAIFAETIEASALAEAVASEIGRPIQVVCLYTGSLGEPGSGADTLIGMLRTNAQRIVEALS